MWFWWPSWTFMHIRPGFLNYWFIRKGYGNVIAKQEWNFSLSLKHVVKNKLLSTLDATNYRAGALYCTSLNMTNVVSTNRNWLWKVKPYDNFTSRLADVVMIRAELVGVLKCASFISGWILQNKILWSNIAYLLCGYVCVSCLIII